MNFRTLQLKAWGCFPVDRVGGLGQHDELGTGDMGALQAHQPGRRDRRSG